MRNATRTWHAKRFATRRLTAAILFACALGAPQASRAADPPPTRSLRVTLTKFSIDLTLDFPDTTDPFAQVEINGVKKRITLPGCGGFATGCIGGEVGLDDTFFAQVAVPASMTSVPVLLSLWDSDSFPRGGDDNAGITSNGKIDLIVDMTTGLWTGDVTSPTNCLGNGTNSLCWKVEVPGDDNCNGIDEDGNGTADDKYEPTESPPCGIGSCRRITASKCTMGVETSAPACVPGSPNPEKLNGFDDDCNGTVDDNIGTFTCAPGQTDWWCCPNGADLRFSVNTAADSLDESAAASSCLPVGVGPPTATCSLRGIVRRAEQLRQVDNVRPACRVVAELQPLDYKLDSSKGYAVAFTELFFGGGILTLKGMGMTADLTIIEPATPTSRRILRMGSMANQTMLDERGEHPPQLTIQNLTMRNGRADEDGQNGGGAIMAKPHQAGGVLIIKDSIFERNHANQHGGAVQFWADGTLTILHSLFRHNQSVALVNSVGGAISAAHAIVNIEGSTFTGNYARLGGALQLDDSTSTLLNNTISGNNAPVIGGGIGAQFGRLTLRFNTIFANMIGAVSSGGFGSARRGGGLATRDTTLIAFGNIIAGSDFAFRPGDVGSSPDCSIFVTAGGAATTTAGSNLIGGGGAGTDCAALGVQSTLIGTPANPLVAQLEPLPTPRLANDPFTCLPGANQGATCIPVCNGLTFKECIAMPRAATQFTPVSPAIGGFPTGASPTGDPNTCPLDDQRTFSRPNAQCSLGSVDPKGVMTMMANGNMSFSMRLPGPPVAYIELFARKNGVQNVTGDFRSSQVANADGTFTYTKIVSGSSYHTGDIVDYRFYYYRSGSPAVFLPGPSASTFYAATTYRRPTATPSQVTCKKANGDMQFTLTVNSRQAYAEAFVQRNGVQVGAGAVTGSAVTNMNGTVTYTRTMPASGFVSTNVIRSRWYHYEPQNPGTGTFEPGPGETIFYPSVVYSSTPVCQ